MFPNVTIAGSSEMDLHRFKDESGESVAGDVREINHPETHRRKPPAKSAAQRAREYRARKKWLLGERAGASVKKGPARSAAEYSRDYRARKKKLSGDSNTAATKIPPRSAAERMREYRDRKKLLLAIVAQSCTEELQKETDNSPNINPRMETEFVPVLEIKQEYLDPVDSTTTSEDPLADDSSANSETEFVPVSEVKLESDDCTTMTIQEQDDDSCVVKEEPYRPDNNSTVTRLCCDEEVTVVKQETCWDEQVCNNTVITEDGDFKSVDHVNQEPDGSEFH